jgi:hypothetical protein
MLRYRLKWLVWRTLVRGSAVHPGGAVGDAGQEAAAAAAPQGVCECGCVFKTRLG